MISVSLTVYANAPKDVTANDTTQVNALNKNGLGNVLSHPQETVDDAKKALEMAKAIGYTKGIAEAYRVKGIGEYYLTKPDSALNSYFDALSQYEKLNDERGKAKVYNNIGNLYQMVDYDRALEYLEKAKVIAEKTKDKHLIASLYLNIGNVYNRKAMYNNALSYYEKSYQLFSDLKDPIKLVLCLQDLGVIHYFLHDYEKAKQFLLEANKSAKDKDLNVNVATINMTLTDIYLAESNFDEAEKYIKEGKTYAEIIHNEKDIYDFKHSAYELESKRKNYAKALSILSELYKADSTGFKTNVSTRLNFLQQEQSRLAKAAEEENNAKINRVIFWSITITAGLLVVVIVLLVGSVKRKATTNSQLQELNSEISRQKDNLDRINHHLEEIIDERTKDLQVKNKKLSEYSSYLSHQIRGPIATLKGLMNLEREGLVDQLECINMMDKCVSEIDEKIIEMSDMLHDPSRTGF
ncbi:tetratricopeptide repeat protein [Mucilaginibacter corticis]|uniref:tetratricopeptide repeat protein n=1 Tax=Mucilaginibacter corticis TaxID=2597670 RepID=UPI001C915E3C|nr:tetratricopeptide repeat protein [Mucilaginibacter corticis]